MLQKKPCRSSAFREKTAYGAAGHPMPWKALEGWPSTFRLKTTPGFTSSTLSEPAFQLKQLRRTALPNVRTLAPVARRVPDTAGVWVKAWYTVHSKRAWTSLLNQPNNRCLIHPHYIISLLYIYFQRSPVMNDPKWPTMLRRGWKNLNMITYQKMEWVNDCPSNIKYPAQTLL